MAKIPFEKPIVYQNALRVLPSKLGGLGVFSDVDIASHEVIERTPVTLFTHKQLRNFESAHGSHGLDTYFFGWNTFPIKDTSEFEEKMLCAYAHGFGSFYNHQFDNNALQTSVTIDMAKFSAFDNTPQLIAKFGDKIPVLTFYATQEIPAGHEITISYIPLKEENDSIALFIRHYGRYVRSYGSPAPASFDALSPIDAKRALAFEQAHQFRDSELERKVQAITQFISEQDSSSAKQTRT